MRTLRFESVDDFIDYLPDYEQRIVNLLRATIHTCIPECTEKLSYNVPYFYRHARICFIWPSSIPWGNVKLNGVQLGFCNGYLLNDDINYLEKGNRKQVYIKTFSDVKEIDVDLIKSYIYDAVMIDDQLKKNKKHPTANSRSSRPGKK